MPRKKKNIKCEEFIPSKYQKSIFDFVKNGNGNAVIEAVAGAGKTFTAIKCLDYISDDCKVLFTAFNTDIVDELKKKIRKLGKKDNIECRTMHSLGYMMLMSNYPNMIDRQPNEFKYRGYIYNNINELSDGFYSRLDKKDSSKYIENVRKFVDFGRYYLCENISDLEFIEKHYNIPVYYNEKDVALKVMSWGKENYKTIDFTDMIWLPNVLNCKPYGKIYDWIICDECQDTMTAERMLLLRCTKMSTRMLFFGEKIQCQPEGTKILMSSGEEKDIKDVVIGDEVVSYNISKNTYSGYKSKIEKNRHVITNIEKHKEHRFLKVNMENCMSSTYTPGHICLVKFNFSLHPKTWCVAVMQNTKGMYFIGTAYLNLNNVHFGLLNNMKDERCVRGWILDIYYNAEDAKINQKLISEKYDIPLAPSAVTEREYKETFIKEELDSFYSDYGYENVEKSVRECLFDYHREIEYPISDANHQIPHARTMLHTMRACNIIPEIMEMSFFSLENKSKKIKDNYRYAASMVKNIEYIDEERDVYSINVDRTHTYVADGIATHNCIYSFMGSDYRSFDELRKLPNTISLPLSISYRCAKNIVSYANRFNDKMEPRDGAEDGSIIFDASIDDINDGDMVLCRNNAPLLQLYCELVKRGKTAYIKGKDVGASLIKTINNTKESKLNRGLKSVGVFSKLYNNLIDEVDTVMKKYKITFEMALEDGSVSQQLDTIIALTVISEGMITSEELIKKISTLFKDKDSVGIRLSTIHKAKGLESDNVFICCPSLMPSKSAKEKWELEEEMNLEYVAYTRAKKRLLFLSENGFDNVSSNEKQVENLKRIRERVFELHGRNNRCLLTETTHEAARKILETKTKLTEKPRNSIELGKSRNNAGAIGLLLKPNKKKKKR